MTSLLAWLKKNKQRPGYLLWKKYDNMGQKRAAGRVCPLEPAADMPCGCWLSGAAKLLVFQQASFTSPALSTTFFSSQSNDICEFVSHLFYILYVLKMLIHSKEQLFPKWICFTAKNPAVWKSGENISLWAVHYYFQLIHYSKDFHLERGIIIEYFSVCKSCINSDFRRHHMEAFLTH